jgi:threonine dehydrogenase-like Zn-dependent dehydrogenase
MRALTIRPGSSGTAALSTVDEPPPGDGPVLVESLLVGVCGTDHELVQGDVGKPPPGHERLIIGHESLGRVLEAPRGADGLAPGDLVVGIVRRPDPVPCGNCAVGEWDMCQNGRYTEHGITGLDGFTAERWRAAPDAMVRVDPGLGDLAVLTEPTSIVAKAWEHVERIGGRAWFSPRTALVTGAGPIGLLAALLGVQRGLDVTVLDRVTRGPKPGLIAGLGATYSTDLGDAFAARPDVVIETTGATPVIHAALHGIHADNIVCLVGLTDPGRQTAVDLGALNNAMVLGNGVVFGTVNANRRHYDAATTALGRADPKWLDRLLTRRVPLGEWESAFERQPDDVKAVLEIAPPDQRA